MFFRKKKLDEAAFVAKMLKALQRQCKDLKIVSIEGLGVNVIAGGEHTFYFDNAYIEYLKDPKDLKAVLDGYCRGFIDMIKDDKDDSVDININRIVPVIKDFRFLETLRELGSDVVSKHIYEQYNSELYIFYAEDNPSTIKYLTQEFFNNLGYTYADLRELALENLSNLVEMKRHGGDGYYMVTAGGDYEASIILLDIWDKETFDVEGNIVIGIPSRDMLLVTGSKNSSGLHRLYDLIEESQNGNYLVSDKLFEWNGTKFEVLQ